MSTITTYSELKTAIADELHRSDLTSYIPNFVRMCESKISNDVRWHDMITRTSFTISTEYTTISSNLTNFLEMIRLQISTDPVVILDYVTPASMAIDYPSAYTGKPRVYTIIGDEIQAKPAADSSYTSEAVYYSRYAYLSADADTNNLLVDHPEIYLYGSCMQASAFMQNDDRIPIWSSLYQQAVTDLNDADKKRKIGGPLRMRPYGPTP